MPLRREHAHHGHRLREQAAGIAAQVEDHGLVPAVGARRDPAHLRRGGRREAQQADHTHMRAARAHHAARHVRQHDRAAHERELHRRVAGADDLQVHGLADPAADQVERAPVGEARERRAVDRRDDVARADAGLPPRQPGDRGRHAQPAPLTQEAEADARIGARLGVAQLGVGGGRQVAGVRVAERLQHRRHRVRAVGRARQPAEVVRLRGRPAPACAGVPNAGPERAPRASCVRSSNPTANDARSATVATASASRRCPFTDRRL